VNEVDCSMYAMCMRMIGKPTKGSVYLDDEGNIDLHCEVCRNNDAIEALPNDS